MCTSKTSVVYVGSTRRMLETGVFALDQRVILMMNIRPRVNLRLGVIFTDVLKKRNDHVQIKDERSLCWVNPENVLNNQQVTRTQHTRQKQRRHRTAKQQNTHTHTRHTHSTTNDNGLVAVVQSRRRRPQDRRRRFRRWRFRRALTHRTARSR